MGISEAINKRPPPGRVEEEGEIRHPGLRSFLKKEEAFSYVRPSPFGVRKPPSPSARGKTGKKEEEEEGDLFQSSAIGSPLPALISPTLPSPP